VSKDDRLDFGPVRFVPSFSDCFNRVENDLYNKFDHEDECNSA
jgi:hypothetical protein